jgi:hypothetical protein
VNIGDSYCEDLLCIGINKVQTAPHGRDVVYSLNAHIFSDANHVKTSAKGAHLYLFDENNRHFPLVQDATVTPFDISLDPVREWRRVLRVSHQPIRSISICGIRVTIPLDPFHFG